MIQYVLGIESSCDDSSLALVEINSKKLLDCLTVSSAELQNQYGGVVPELAAREHEKHLILLLQKLLEKHNLTWDQISHIAYTDHPGLINCLLVAKIFAQTLSLIFSKPLLPINHVYGHIFSPGLSQKLFFPFISLVVSGKTTAFYFVENEKNITLLEETLDNALGESYDKVARKIGLGYPGGKKIDELFDEKLVVISLLKNQLSPQKPISYSGIITAANILWEKIQNNASITDKQAYLATVFQKFIIDNLTNKIKYWLCHKNVSTFSIAGGVAANSYLRKKINDLKIRKMFAEQEFCQDNAAMIAYFATWLIKK